MRAHGSFTDYTPSRGEKPAFCHCAVNKKALELFGYKQGELEQKNLRILLPPPFSTNHSQYIQRYLKTGAASVYVRKARVQPG